MEGYIDKDHIELINKFSVEDPSTREPVPRVRYHIFFKGRIYNLMSISITFVDDQRQDIRKTIFEVFEKYDFNFKKLNDALNGDYALVIVKEVSEKIEEVWMSTDHIANIKLWWFSKGSKIQFSLKEFEGAYLMPAGFMSNVRLNEQGEIKEEIFMEYEEVFGPRIPDPRPRIRDLSSAYVLVGFALDCIIEKRLKYTNKIFKGESVYDKYIMKVAKLYAKPCISDSLDEDTGGEECCKIQECSEGGPDVIRGIFNEDEVSGASGPVTEEGIYPFLDKTFMRLMSRVDEPDELLRRLFSGL